LKRVPRRAAAALLSVALVLSGCLRPMQLNQREDARTTRSEMDSWPLDRLLTPEKIDALEVRSFVYEPAKFPLSDFFRRLERGDFSDALKSLKLSRTPSAIDSKALRLLIQEGFVPVLVDVANAGDVPFDASRLRFRLEIGAETLLPISNQNVPLELRRLDPKAPEAMAYNTGVLIVDAAELALLVAAVAALVVVAARGGGSISVPGSSAGARTPADQGCAGTDGLRDRCQPAFKVSATKTVDVDASALLWSPRVLAPDEEARGLLFFRRAPGMKGEVRLRTALALTP